MRENPCVHHTAQSCWVEAHLCLRFVPALSHDFLWFIYNLCVPREVKGRGNRSKMTTSQDNPQQRYTMQTDPDVVNAIKKFVAFKSFYLSLLGSGEVNMRCLCFSVFASRGSVVDGYREREDVGGKGGGEEGKGYSQRLHFYSSLTCRALPEKQLHHNGLVER